MTFKVAAFTSLALLVAGAVSGQTVRNISVPVKVADGAVNTFIGQQWTRQGWDSFSGAVAGCGYVLNVPSPSVRLTSGHGTLTLGVEIISSNCGGGPWNVTLSPTLAIP